MYMLWQELKRDKKKINVAPHCKRAKYPVGTAVHLNFVLL